MTKEEFDAAFAAQCQAAISRLETDLEGSENLDCLIEGVMQNAVAVEKTEGRIPQWVRYTTVATGGYTATGSCPLRAYSRYIEHEIHYENIVILHKIKSRLGTDIERWGALQEGSTVMAFANNKVMACRLAGLRAWMERVHPEVPLVFSAALDTLTPLELARRRPKTYHDLSVQQQWDIDKNLGILDWDGADPPGIQSEIAVDEENRELRRDMAAMTTAANSAIALASYLVNLKEKGKLEEVLDKMAEMNRQREQDAAAIVAATGIKSIPDAVDAAVALTASLLLAKDDEKINPVEFLMQCANRRPM